jgi:Cu/Ag efflux pump CusA
MIPRLIQWSIRNRPIVVIAAVVLIAWGVFAASRMPMDVLPDLDAPTETVITESPAMAQQQIEQLLTIPIQAAVEGARRS